MLFTIFMLLILSYPPWHAFTLSFQFYPIFVPSSSLLNPVLSSSIHSSLSSFCYLLSPFLSIPSFHSLFLLLSFNYFLLFSPLTLFLPIPSLCSDEYDLSACVMCDVSWFAVCGNVCILHEHVNMVMQRRKKKIGIKK